MAYLSLSTSVRLKLMFKGYGYGQQAKVSAERMGSIEMSRVQNQRRGREKMVQVIAVGSF
jgi:hypothetical protein